MKVKVAWHLNNWTMQGPGSISVYCIIDKGKFTGWDERPGHHTNSGAQVRFATFENFMELLDLCRASVKKIKAGPQDDIGRVRESVSIDGIQDTYKWGYQSIEWTKRFYEYGSTSPRHKFEDFRDAGEYEFVALLIDYIDDDNAPPACVIEDYIKEFYEH